MSEIDKNTCCWKCGKEYSLEPVGDKEWIEVKQCDCPAYFPTKVEELQLEINLLKEALRIRIECVQCPECFMTLKGQAILTHSIHCKYNEVEAFIHEDESDEDTF